ncbi:pgk [Acrasis kona]|uniref:Pgk n=1 Tax=Acrasis kona TaxID=1008807 RepID=A0AAW2Z7I2_9EUKA
MSNLRELNSLFDDLLKDIAVIKKTLQDRRSEINSITNVGIAEPKITPHDVNDTPTVTRLKDECNRLGLQYAKFKQVPGDYYDRPLEYRRDCLGAPTIDHLCKSLIMENTRFQGDDPFADRNNCKYYCIVLQYTARLHSDKITRFVSKLNKGKLSNQSFNFRLADEKEQEKLTGFGHNAVVPIGMVNDKIPVIISEKITKLSPYQYFWMGAGEVDWKLEVDVQEFVKTVGAFVADVTYEK